MCCVGVVTLDLDGWSGLGIDGLFFCIDPCVVRETHAEGTVDVLSCLSGLGRMMYRSGIRCTCWPSSARRPWRRPRSPAPPGAQTAESSRRAPLCLAASAPPEDTGRHRHKQVTPILSLLQHNTV